MANIRTSIPKPKEPEFNHQLNYDEYEGNYYAPNGGTVVMTGTIRPDHYKGDGKYECIDVIEDLCKTSKNDRFTDYNRFQASR